MGRPGTFKKGQSGNPGGRPKAVIAVVEAAQSHCPRAVARLAELLESDDGHVATAAAKALLERGYGRPFQPVTGQDGGAIETVAQVIILPDNGRSAK